MTHPVCAEPVRAGFFFQQPEIFPLFLILCGNLPANAIIKTKRSNYNGKISVQSISECNFI